jgi:ankyrin repeat protein
MSLAASKIRPEPNDTMSDNARYTRVINMLQAHGVPLGLFGSIGLGDIDRLRTLLEANPALANQKEPGGPVLHYATRLGRQDIVSLLLDRGADVNTTDDHGSTALHVAAFWGREEIAKILIRHEADVHACTRAGMTPLHESARLGTPAVAKLLLAAGAKVHTKDRQGRTPLDWAKDSAGRSYSKPGHAEVMKLLRGHGGEG